MSLFDEIRQAAPWAKDLSDREILDKGVELTGLSPKEVAGYLGVTEKRGIFGAANDYAIEFANAVASLPKAALDIVKPGTEASAAIGRFIEEGEKKQSLEAAEAKFQLGRSMQSESLAEQAGGAFKYVRENPMLAASQAIGSFVGPGAAIKGGKMIGGALGLTERGVARAGLTGGSAAGAVLAGGDAAGDAYQMVMNAPELQDLPIEQREKMATDAARKATPLPFVIGAASGLVGADKAFAAGTKSILRTTGVEAGSEFIEEGATKLSANLAAGEMAPSIQPMTGVIGSATLGGLLGGGTGAVVGTLNRVTAPGSLLPGSTNLSTGEATTPDGNAINKAIDANSSEILVGPPQRTRTEQEVAAVQAQIDSNPVLNPRQNIESQIEAARVAQTQAEQQAAQQRAEQQAAFDEISSTYGVQPTQVAGRYTVAGKTLFTQADATKFLADLDALNQDKTPEQKSIIGAALNSGAVKVPLKSNAKTVNNAAVKFLSEWGIDSSADKADAAERADVLIGSLEGPKALKEADQLNSFYKALTGKDAPAFVALQQLASETTKGATNERQQLRVPSPAGLGTVSEQGRAAEASPGVSGPVRPNEVRPIGTGSNLILPSTVQNVGPGSVRARVEPSAGRVSNAVPSTGQEAQVIPDDRIEALERVRTIVNSAFGTRDGGIVMEYLTGEKTSVEIAKEYGVSDARIAQIAGPTAQETWGARIFAAAKRLGYTKDDVYNLLVKSTAKAETETEAQALTEEDLDFEAVAAREAAVSDEAGPSMAEEAAMVAEKEDQTLGREETSEKEGGGASGFRVFNPQVSGATELEDAASANRTYQKFKKKGIEALKDFELNNLAIDERIVDSDLDAIIKEINRRQEVRVAKGEDNAVQKRSTKRVSVRKQAEARQRVPSEDTERDEAAAEAEQADEEVSARTLEEQAEQAWNRGIKDFPDAPKFSELSEEQQADWISFGEENWTPEDVQTELVKLAKMMTPAQSVQRSFSENNPLIDPQSQEVDAALRGKTIQEAMNWALSKARNDYERTVLRAIDARLKELASLGVEFSFSLTNPGKQLTGNASGISIYTPAGLGQAQKIDVILNGAHTGDKAGTNYETLVHELIHAVTQGQIKMAPDSSAAKQLRELFNEIVTYYNKRAADGTLNEFEKRYFQRENNSLADPDELLAWGLTNKDFQEYLASVVVSPKVTFWDKFVKLISSALNLPVRSDSALANLMAISEGMFTESLTPYIAEANKRFQSFGKQTNVTKWPTWSLNADYGAPVWVEGDYSLYKATNRLGNTIYLPGIKMGDTSGVARVDVGSFKGALPADVLSRMKTAADALRVQVSPSIRTNISKSANLNKVREATAQQVAKLPKPIRGPLQQITDNIVDFAKKGLPYFAFTEDLADLAAKFIPSAKKYVQLIKEQQAVKTRFERRVDQILQKYDALPDQVKGVGENSVNQFLKDMTMKGEWAYDPNIKGAKIDPELKARFDAFPAAAQNLIKEVFTHGQQVLKAMQDAVIRNINTEYDALIAAAQKAGDAQEVAELTKKKANSLTEYRTLMRVNSKSPYAPLKRFGNYVVVGRSQAYLDQENIRDNPNSTPDQVAEANSKLREMEKNQDHYFVQFAETMGEAKAIARDEETNYALVEPFEKDTARTALYGGADVQGLFYRLRNMVEETQDDNTADKSQRAINRLLSDLHLTMLSEQSARQSERRRRKIAGAEKDMMRAFATQGRATAHFISSLENSDEIYDSLRQMKAEADARTPGRAERRRYYNEFMKRHVMSLDYEPSPFIDKALNTTSVWMLLTNPAYYLQNMTQPFMMSLPVIGAKHGYDKAWKEFTNAYSDIASVIRKHGLDENSYNKLPADVRDVVEELVNRGRIDISLEQDLGRWRSTEDSKLAKFGRATEYLRGIAQDIESINRVATAVAAYRLEARVNKNNAIDYADKVIYTTHGDYSVGNAPRISRKGLGRLATQFRKFQLIQLSLMARLFNDAFAGQDEQTRQIGRRALMFTIGHTAAMGGVMGLPGFAALSFLYGLVFGDEDEPDNPELAMRRAIGDDFLADLLVKGVPAAMGVDVSGKIGMGQMLSILPYTDIDFSKAGVAQAGYALMTGPFGGLTLKAADGLSLMGQGSYYKGIEQLMPTGLAQVMKGYRFATEGVTSRTDDVLISPDEVSTLEAFMVGLGLPTKQFTDKQFLQSAKFEYDQFYNDKASEIKRVYARAYRKGDGAALSEARQDWEKLQQSRVRNGYTRQPLSTLLKAPQEQAKRERGVVGGVTTNRANKGFVRQTSEL
jgi:hypothetical protein